MDRKELKTLLDTAKGKTPPDTVIVNGRILNVFTNQIDKGVTIAIKDGFIVSMEEDGAAGAYGDAQIIDASGFVLSPGFIDAHTHMDGMLMYSEFVPYAIRGGTTAIVTETSAAVCAMGIDGVRAIVEAAQGYPVSCYFLAPPLTPPFPEMESSMGLTLSEFRRLLKRDDFLGIGEAYWTRIVEGDSKILGQAEAALSLNKALDGHAAGARGKRLTEYMLTGITSCHESTTMDELMEKMRLGLYIMIREGWVRRELKELSKIKDSGVDLRRIMLVSDVFDAVMLVEEGYIDSIVRRAIQCGIPPIEAIKMVTINPADYYHLRYHGAIAPLRKADILFLDDMETVSVARVMAGGKVVYADGKFLWPLQPSIYPEKTKKAVTASKIHEEDLKVKAGGDTRMVRAVEISNETITREIHWQAKVKDGYLAGDPSEDVIPVTVISRRDSKKMGKGFIRGTGIGKGALATTLIWDTGNILAVGSNYPDMMLAVNRLIDCQGGIIIVMDGEVIYEFPMPVMGIIPTATVEECRLKILELDEKMRTIGTKLARPYLTVQTIPFTGLPFLRITDRGLADIRKRRLVPLFL